MIMKVENNLDVEECLAQQSHLGHLGMINPSGVIPQLACLCSLKQCLTQPFQFNSS